MTPLFEVYTDKYLHIHCKKIVNYDGRDFPEIINEVLLENKGNVIFGGSSLIHDLYFKEETWDRDYDLWCDENTYKKLKTNFYRRENFRKLNEEIFSKNSENSYYGNFQSQGIAEFIYNINESSKIKIQLIDVGKKHKICKMFELVDFSFNTVFYDGEKLIYHDTTEEQVKAKTGILRVKTSRKFCPCHFCSKKESRLSEKQLLRIKKYQKRGFNLTNLCPFCEFKYPCSINHCYYCLAKKLKLKVEMKFYQAGDNLTQQSLEKIVDLCSMYRKEEIIYTMLIYILSTRNLNLFKELFENNRHIIDPYSLSFYTIFEFLLDNGIYEPFVSFFEIVEPHFTEYSYLTLSGLFFGLCRKNYVNLASYFSKKIGRCKFELFGDKIISHRFLNIFEYYFEEKDVSIITNTFKYITVCNDPTEDSEMCGICHTDFPNLKLSCRHRYCHTCLITYFAMEYKKNSKLSCPMCRIKF